MKSVLFSMVLVIGLTGCGDGRLFDFRGEKGTSLVGQQGGQGEQGVQGEQGEQGEQGVQGETGSQGPTGPTGASGTSCTVVTIVGGSRVTCGDTTTDVLDGLPGTPATSVVQIALCPNITGGLFTEYLLRIGSNLFGVYASGQNIGLTKLSPGTWQTSDGRNCVFTVNADNTVTY